MKHDIIFYKNEFESSYSQIERFLKSVKNQFEEILIDEKIDLGFPLQFRIKTWDSIREKIESGRFNLKKSIFELQDLIGLRIIILSLTDIKKIVDIVERDFEVSKKYNTVEKLNDDQFGYNSLHYVLKIPDSWRAVPSLKHLENFQFELQIRTLSQHIWAETSNAFEYKTASNVPRELLRSIGRISALLETVDFEIDRLILERKSYIENLSKQPESDSLNVDMVEKLLTDAFGSNRYSENPQFDIIIDELNTKGYTEKKHLTSLISKYKNAFLSEESNFLKEAIKTKSSEIVNGFGEKGYLMDYLGIIRYILRKEQIKRV